LFLDNYCKEEHLPYYIDTGINFINVIVTGTTKGTGMRMVTDFSGIDLAGIAGIGDSDADLEFLDLCGFTACPSNGSARLKKSRLYLAISIREG